MALQTVDVSKTFTNVKALDKVSIEVEEQSIFGLLGPNGAGKTTLIRIINMITAMDEGQVLLNGQPVKQDDIRHIGYLPEERGLYKKMKVGEQAVYLARLKGLSKQDAMKRLKFWFEKFGITSWWNKKVEELSKGMQQKVQFVVTVLHNPKLLIFDEPFSGFDPINVNLLKEEILNLRDKGSTIIFSTHNMASVEELCDHIALINNSKLILSGEIHDIKQQFKSNIFEVVYRSPKELLLNTPPFEVIDKQSKNGEQLAKIRINETSNANELLKNILTQAEVVSFREILPSVNDIFIQEVEKSSNNR
ncbi:MAG: ABC transporter ATP-binding protein [Chlorobi bacterium]|nr:ABC transporter ATP-binding protein [Chlorobiota bacterium]